MPTYKINYSGGKPRVINVNKLPNKTSLQSLDRVYLGQPFVNVVSKFQDTRGLDTIYLGQPFYGHTDAIAIPSSRISTTNHPDVNNWLNTVALNGGSASSSTIAALNVFCNSIESAGLRNKFYRLNLFCGNNLQACLVPIYGAVTPDINYNNNFISSDYNETGASGGLQGNGVSKGLLTGMSVSSFSTNFHVSTYVSVISTTTNTYDICGMNSDTNNDRIGLGCIFFAAAGYVFSCYQLANTPYTAQISGYGPGFYIGSCATNTAKLYKNASIVGNTTNTGSNRIPQNYPIMIFGGSQSGSNIMRSFSPARLNAYSIGDALTDSEASSFNTIMQTFQTALNRNV
jgi:hypothetical protein